jgi:hypothetical protein
MKRDPNGGTSRQDAEHAIPQGRGAMPIVDADGQRFSVRIQASPGPNIAPI